MRLRFVLVPSVLVATGLAAVFVACGGTGFDPQSKVDSVRLFGVRADEPFANPGDTVTLEALATDARRNRARPMKIFWLPVVCTNPKDDLYYSCFVPAPDGGASSAMKLVPPFPSDADAGAAVGLASIPTGVDLGAYLPQGSTFRFQMPSDVIVPRASGPAYGLAIVFNIVCAGQVRLGQRVGGAPQQVPIQCTDEQGNALSPNDYVIAINRVYSYSDRTNTNPDVTAVTLDGNEVDASAGMTIDRCVADRRADCPASKIGVKVTDQSWEPNPGEGAAAGQHEQIWATYYSDIGEFKDDARLLFDPLQGRVSDSDIEYRAPNDPGEGTIWIVVHDNRAGAAFRTIPLHIK